MALKLAARGALLVDPRGLAGRELRLLSDLRQDTFFADVGRSPGGGLVDLKPGEEVAVPVEVPDLPRNANVATIEATLTVVRAPVEDGAADATEVTVTTGSGPDAPSQAFAVSVTPSGLPSNLQVRLDQGELIWTHGGTLDAGSHPLGDFAPQANRYLDQVKLPPGPTTLQFLVKSDTPGRARVAIADESLEYTLLQTETWENPLDGSIRIDRNLELDFGSVDRIELDSLVDPVHERMAAERVMFDVTGDLGPERLLGRLARHDGAQFATVSSDYSVAQAIRLSSDASLGLGFKPGATIRAAGVTSVLRVGEEAELYAELRTDGGNRPSSDPPIASLTATLAADEAPAASSWTFAAFETPTDLDVDRDYWIVFRGIRGAARLALVRAQGEYLGTVLVNRGGQLWRPFDSARATEPARGLSAVVRLVYVPGLDDQTAAVELRLEGDLEPLLTDPVETTQRVTLEAPGGAARGASVVVTSHARGTLRVANVVQEFAAVPQGRVR